MSLILMVDDDTDMLRMAERWMKKAGYETATAASGKEAVAFLAGTKPDLIVLDYLMPEMDGPATLAAIREVDGGDSIPVLFRTGKDDGVTDDVMQSGHVAGVVPKSEGKTALLRVVGEVLG
ncbi:MAG: response regulator [Lachnospiraceae bacterium]|nr:response regulator [Lachnospiraceae bacterium]